MRRTLAETVDGAVPLDKRGEGGTVATRRCTACGESIGFPRIRCGGCGSRGANVEELALLLGVTLVSAGLLAAVLLPVPRVPRASPALMADSTPLVVRAAPREDATIVGHLPARRSFRAAPAPAEQWWELRSGAYEGGFVRLDPTAAE